MVEADPKPEQLPAVVQALVEASTSVEAAVPLPAAASSDSDNESDLTEPLPSGGEDDRPSTSSKQPRSTSKKAAAPFKRSTAVRGKKAPVEKPKTKARARKVIQDDSSADEKNDEQPERIVAKADKGEKMDVDKDAESSDLSEQEDVPAPPSTAKKPKTNKDPAPESTKKPKRPTLQRKDSKQKSQTSSSAPSKAAEAPAKVPEKFKAKTKSGSFRDKEKDKDRDGNVPPAGGGAAPPRPKSSGGLPTFRKKSTIDEEKAKQIKLQKEAPAPPGTAVLAGLTSSGQADGLSAKSELQPAVTPSEGPDLANLFDMDIVPDPAPAEEATAAAVAPATGASTAKVENDAMQIDQTAPEATPEQMPSPSKQEPGATVSDAEPASVPAAATQPEAEAPAPPRRVSFMAYKQRTSAVAAAPTTPSTSATPASIAEEPPSSVTKAAEPKRAIQADVDAIIAEASAVAPISLTEQALVETPLVERSEMEAMAGLTDSHPEVVAQAASPEKMQEETFVAPAVVPVAPPMPPPPRARLSFAAYRQRLGTTPASPSEGSTAASTPAALREDADKQLASPVAREESTKPAKEEDKPFTLAEGKTDTIHSMDVDAVPSQTSAEPDKTPEAWPAPKTATPEAAVPVPAAEPAKVSKKFVPTPFKPSLKFSSDMLAARLPARSDSDNAITAPSANETAGKSEGTTLSASRPVPQMAFKGEDVTLSGPGKATASSAETEAPKFETSREEGELTLNTSLELGEMSVDNATVPPVQQKEVKEMPVAEEPVKEVSSYSSE